MRRAARLLALRSQLPADRRRELLRLLVDHDVQCPWDLLAPLSVPPDPQGDALLVQILAPSATIAALPWLLEQIARATAWPAPGTRAEAEVADAVQSGAWHATELLLGARDQLAASTPSALDPTPLQRVTAQLQADMILLERAWAHDAWDETAAEQYAQAIEERRAVVRVFTALSGRR